MEILAFKPQDLLDIERPEDWEGGALIAPDQMKVRAEMYATAGPALTCRENGKIVNCGGVVQFWKGVGEAWLVVSKEAQEHPKAVFESSKILLETCFLQHGFHRVHACIIQHHPTAHKMIIRLGFVPEGIMVYYGPNKENFWRYVRFK